MRYTQLTKEERYQISAHLTAGFSPQEIAEKLGRSPATISRELMRNSTRKGYSVESAQQRADKRKQSHRHVRITEQTWEQVEQLVRQDWSPEQINGRLKKQKLPTISHEWIYQYIWNDKKAGGDLFTHLRWKKKRKKRYGRPTTRGQIKGRVGIDQRPPAVEARSRIGDWEVDTVIGQQGGGVLVTITERKTRFTLVAWSKNKTAIEVMNSLIAVLLPLVDKVKTLTFDNGKEFALHTQISEQLQAKSYFAHPYHSWERGLNENTNGLLRQYAPKGSNFDKLTQQDVDYMMNQLNNRPRKCLGYKTPNEVMFGIKPTIALAS